MTKVRIETAAPAPVRAGALSGLGLERPQAGDEGEGHVLRISGWAAGAGQEVTHFELVHRGTVVERVAAAAREDGAPGAGLELAVSTLDLPYEFKLAVRAVLADGARVRVATLAGSRTPLPAGASSGPVPVLLTTIGRSGSTALTNLLSHHPDCASYHPWTTEARMVTYWAAVLRTLARPASFERQLYQPAGIAGRFWWIGEPPQPAMVREDGPALAALAWAGLPGAVEFCRAQIGRLGAAMASEAGKPGARHLIEKVQPDSVRSAAETMEELDPRTREILLVRDLRDTACSMRSYAARTGAAFGPPGDSSIEGGLRWLGVTTGKLLADYVTRRRGAAHVTRYEDLVTSPEATLTDALRFIGLDAAPATVAGMIAGLDASDPRFRDAHVTSTSAAQSIGRWRQELTPAQQALAEECLRPQLDVLGYE